MEITTLNVIGLNIIGLNRRSLGKENRIIPSPQQEGTPYLCFNGEPYLLADGSVYNVKNIEP